MFTMTEQPGVDACVLKSILRGGGVSDVGCYHETAFLKDDVIQCLQDCVAAGAAAHVTGVDAELCGAGAAGSVYSATV